MSSALVMLVVLTSNLLVAAQHQNYILSDHFIDFLNQANSTWTAGRK